MLILSRKRSQEIVVDGPCVVKVVEIRGDKVRIGIEAGKDVVIDRKEVHERRTEGKLAEARVNELAE